MVERTLQICALKSSEFVLDQVKGFTRDLGKKPLILLTVSAFAIKDAAVEWLDPTSLTYRGIEPMEKE